MNLHLEVHVKFRIWGQDLYTVNFVKNYLLPVPGGLLQPHTIENYNGHGIAILLSLQAAQVPQPAVGVPTVQDVTGTNPPL